MHSWSKVLVLVLAGVVLVGAGEPWKLSLDIRGNISYASPDWEDDEAAGTLIWSLRGEGTAEKQIGTKLNSKTVLKLEFGQTSEKDRRPEKSADLIDLESVLKTTLGGWVDPFIALRGESRFVDNTYWYARYANPTKFSESLGAMRVLLKKKQTVWDLRLGAAAKQKIDRWAPLSVVGDSVQVIDGVDTTMVAAKGDTTIVTNAGGIELVTELNTVLLKEMVKVKSTLRIYEAIFHADQDFIGDEWRYPDINWKTSFTVNVAKRLDLGYTIEFDYDYENDRTLQHRHAATIGVTLSNAERLKKRAEAEKAAPAAPAEAESAPAQAPADAPAAEPPEPPAEAPADTPAE